MRVMQHDTADAFLDAASAWLEKEEAANNLILGLALSRASGEQAVEPPVMITVSGRYGIAAAMVMTIPPQIALLYAPDGSSTEGLERVAEALLDRGAEVCGCMGTVEAARVFADIWAAHAGAEVTLKERLRVHELHEVQYQGSVAGELRVATADDLELATDWRYRFCLEALGEDNTVGARSTAEQQIAQGKLFFWEDGKRPVCQAVASRRTRCGIGVGAVYTPPAFRCRGYATACVAALSQQQLDAGCRFCCLYTDLANPTSNSIYRKIGYIPVADVDHYSFIS